MSLRDVMARDIHRVFTNPNEFAELHTWQSNPKDPATIRTLPMIFETFTLDGRPLPAFEGISVHRATVHVPHETMGYTPTQDEWVRVDGREYNIVAVDNAFGMLKIIIEANRSGL